MSDCKSSKGQIKALKKIEKLRSQHTEAFNSGDFKKMERINSLIILSWEAYHRASLKLIKEA